MRMSTSSRKWLARVRLRTRAQASPPRRSIGRQPTICHAGAILAGVPNPSRTSDFVGRGTELATVAHACDDAREGLPSVLLIGGDAGIGKSTLVSVGAERAGVPVYFVRCQHIGGEVTPLAPFADLIRQIRRSCAEALDSSPAVAALARWFTDSTTAAHVAQSPGGLFVAMLELITCLADHDAVLVGVEDLHWADAATWDLFEFLARNLVEERIVLVGTYRANEIAGNPTQRRRVAELTRLPIVHRIQLEGLDRVDVAKRVASMLGHPAPVSLIDEVVARGQGNPFFTEELVAAHLAGDAIPAVLSDLISADMADLDDATRGVLHVVAAFGHGVSHDLLMKVAELDERAVEAAIRVAVDAQLVVVDSSTDEYRFRHALISEVVYAELLPSQRRRLHRRIADVLMERPAQALMGMDGELAFHLDRAGDRAGAFVALLAAADASETVAPGAALRLLDRALELWDDGAGSAPHEQRVHRLWQAAELANGTVDNVRAIELARAAMVLGPPPRGAAWGHERLGRYLWAAGRHAESAVEFERAAALLASDDHRGASASAFAGLAQAELMLRHYESAERWCRRVFELVPIADADPLAWVMAQRLLGVIRSAAGNPDEGVALCREAVKAAPSAQTRAFASLYLAHTLLDAARFQEGVNVALDAVVDAQLAGLDGNFGGYLDALAAEGLVRLGRWSDADNVLSRHVGVDPLPVGAIRLCRARAILAARRGDIDRAHSLLVEARAQPVDPFHQALLDSVSAEVCLALGEWGQAAVAAESGWASSCGISPLWMGRFAMLSVGAEIELALDAQAQRQPIDLPSVAVRLRVRLDAVEHAVQSSGCAVVAVDTAAHLAHAEATLSRIGEPDPDACAHAARLWAELGDPWAAATARLREAEAASSTGATSRAASSLHDAQRIATELGATPLLAEIAAVSRRTRLSLEAPTPRVLGKQSIDQLGLTPREAEVLAQVAAGHTNRQIGESLYISEKTASVHVSNILRKLGVTGRVDAAAIAQRLGVA